MNDMTIEESTKTLEMMATKKFRDDFFTQLKSRYPLFNITTNGEKRFDMFLKHFCRVNGYECYLWDCHKGLIELNTRKKAAGTDEATIRLPNGILEHIREEALSVAGLGDDAEKDKVTNLKRKGKRGVIFVLHDFFRFIDPKTVSPQPDTERRLKSLVDLEGHVSTIMTGPRYAVPEVLENLVPTIDFPYPNKNEIKTILWVAVSVIGSRLPNLRDETIEMEEDLVNAVSGLTLLEAQTAFSKSLVLHKGWNIRTLLEEKKQIIAKSGMLEFYDRAVSIDEIGGLKNLKKWVKNRQHCFGEEAEAYGLKKPKGLLTLGMPGCGKSLTCKAISSLWNMPLLRLDFGKMFNSHIGASEENIRNAIKLAETIAPCITGDTNIVVNNRNICIEDLFNKKCSEDNEISIFKDELGNEVQRIVYLNKIEKNVIQGYDDGNVKNIRLKAITRTTKKGKLIKITTKSGKEIITTREHLLMDENKKMKKAKEFSDNDRISIVYSDNIQGDICEKKKL